MVLLLMDLSRFLPGNTKRLPLLSSAARCAMPRMRSEAFSAIISTQALIDVPLQTIYRASWPFVWIIVAGMVLCALFPELITLLPRLSGPN